MNIRFASDEERNQWNTHVLANPDKGNLFQGYEFAEQKRLGGWTPRLIMSDSLAITVLEKSIFGLGCLWYIPKGPGVVNADDISTLLPELRKFASQCSVFAIKIEPEFVKTNEILAALRNMHLLPATPIQPNVSTVTLDLSPPLETILSSLNQKGRHALRRAERDGVTIQRVETSDENCEQFYQLLSETAAGSFRIRSKQYYRTYWQRYSAANQGQLFFAYVDNKIVAGAYAITFGTKSTYKDGASIRERVVYGASHLLQWEVIQWAKEKGSLIHDLCGTPPSDQIKNEQHPYYGIGRFKTSFNKEVTDYVGVFDVPIRPLQYRIWSAVGEKITLRIHSHLHHENWY